MYIAVSGMNSSSHIQLGRPFGGVAIIWDKNINNYIQSIDTESKRVAAVLFTNATDKLLFITAYMPCDTGVCDVNRAAEDFYDVLKDISRIVHVYDEYEVVIGGDFNTAYIKNNAHSTLLRNFCEDESLVNANMHKNADIDYTYCNYASGTTYVIDHFLLTEQAYDSIINVHVVHSGTNLSHHDPLILQMRAPHQTIKTSDECRSRYVNWHKATVIDLDAYSDAVSSNLLNLPICEGINCNNCNCNIHQDSLNKLCTSITKACVDAAGTTLPVSGSATRGNRHNIVISWNEHVEPFRKKSLLWHKIWLDNNKPKSGLVADIMRSTRCQYHSQVKWVKQNIRFIQSPKMAKSMVEGKASDFWAEVKMIRGCKATVTASVDGEVDDGCIADLFANKYKTL